MSALIATAQQIRTRITHRFHHLPVVILMPHSACNCRCVMCDIWKANAEKKEIAAEVLSRHLASFRRLSVRWVVLSGGEALMHSNLWTLCELLKSLPVKITLLSTGLLLRRHAENVVRWCDEVIVSLDGSREVHNRIRNVPEAYEKLVDGIQALRAICPNFHITGRCVLQKMNFFDLPNIILAAQEIGLKQISFLAADVFSTAFNRAEPWASARIAEVALSENEVRVFAALVEKTLIDFAEAFRCGFIAESPDKFQRLPKYFAAVLGKRDFPQVRCSAPWISTVIEADGAVRPCFFHPALGNLHEKPLDAILNSEQAVEFRKNLAVQTNPVCRKCTCSLHLKPWAYSGKSHIPE
jgi:MoaA/NifB/PqqE/SkfB family radical SAM enzyme